MTNELAIRIITGDVLGTSEQTQEAIIMAVKALSMPSANQWIKCSDRLPPVGEQVLVWAYGQCYLLTLYEHTNKEGYYWNVDDYDVVDDEFDKILAWMPLPQYSEDV